MAENFPVTVAVSRPDGSTEHVRVGTATRVGDSFRLSLELTMSTSASAAPARGVAAPRGVPPRLAPAPAGAGETVFPNYGRSKGMPIQGATRGDLEFYANGARRSLNDPGKARFHDKERSLLATIEAELARQGVGGGSEMGDDGVPPPSDADAPQYDNE